MTTCFPALRLTHGAQGFSKEQLEADNLNSQIYNSFLDGSKSALEMAAVVNGCAGLSCPETLNFPPCGYQDLAQLLRPTSAGGKTKTYGTVEVTSSLERDGRDVINHARHGVFVVFEGMWLPITSVEDGS